MDFSNSELLHKEALEHIVGGVNSPSRSYKAVGGGSPVAMDHAKGAYFWDVDGNKYIDYLAAYGPIITGHAHPHSCNLYKHKLDILKERISVNKKNPFNSINVEGIL